ncbi:D-amino acid aminotransferase [Thalassotalea atypica]|uniref:D-amino acid aminotransferase n=1 Tax=Thalassotalea atypica TaxID=2054316 RepID=UPI002573E9D7|nr:D-amino acid aminotransferase [Thalassotalea atypica]
MSQISFLNGKFVAASQAKVSVYDRGFLFGDAVYEVIPIYQSRPFRPQDHLDRLQNSLKAIALKLDYCDKYWHALIDQMIKKNNGGNLSLYIQITRGSEIERDHVGRADTEPTVLMMVSPLSTEIASLTPIKTTLLPDIRWKNCFIKTTALLGNVMLKQQASQAGYEEAILRRENIISEGTTSNVFMVKNGIIYTPIANQYILAGITREVIIEIAENASIKVIQQNITVEQLLDADEIWLSSSSREISPVTQIDDKIVAKGTIGPVTAKMHQLFQAFKRRLTGS